MPDRHPSQRPYSDSSAADYSS